MKNEFSIHSFKLRLRNHPKGYFKDVSDEHLEFMYNFNLEFIKKTLKNPPAPVLNFQFARLKIRYKKTETILKKQIKILWDYYQAGEHKDVLIGMFEHYNYPEDHPLHKYSSDQLDLLTVNYKLSDFKPKVLKIIWRVVKLTQLLMLHTDHWISKRLHSVSKGAHYGGKPYEAPHYIFSYKDRIRKYRIWDASLSETYLPMLKEMGEICLGESYRIPSPNTLKSNLPSDV